MIIAFEGWADAGEAASRAITHLVEDWRAISIAKIDSDEYYDFQTTRPVIRIDEERGRVIEWPATQIWAARKVQTNFGTQDFILVRGIEPNLQWRQFADSLLQWALGQRVQQIITLGALLSDTPHSRPIRVGVNSWDEDVMHRFGLHPSDYDGPIGITGVIHFQSLKLGIAPISLWSDVPHYVAHPPSPKATLALLMKLSELIGIQTNLIELQEDAKAWQLGVDRMAQEDGDIAEYVGQLEEACDAEELPKVSGETIAEEFERYLGKYQQ